MGRKHQFIKIKRQCLMYRAPRYCGLIVKLFFLGYYVLYMSFSHAGVVLPDVSRDLTRKPLKTESGKMVVNDQFGQGSLLNKRQSSSRVGPSPSYLDQRMEYCANTTTLFIPLNDQSATVHRIRIDRSENGDYRPEDNFVLSGPNRSPLPSGVHYDDGSDGPKGLWITDKTAISNGGAQRGTFVYFYDQVTEDARAIQEIELSATPSTSNSYTRLCGKSRSTINDYYHDQGLNELTLNNFYSDLTLNAGRIRPLSRRVNHATGEGTVLKGIYINRDNQHVLTNLESLIRGASFSSAEGNELLIFIDNNRGEVSLPSTVRLPDVGVPYTAVFYGLHTEPSDDGNGPGVEISDSVVTDIRYNGTVQGPVFDCQDVSGCSVYNLNIRRPDGQRMNKLIKGPRNAFYFHVSEQWAEGKQIYENDVDNVAIDSMGNVERGRQRITTYKEGRGRINPRDICKVCCSSECFHFDECNSADPEVDQAHCPETLIFSRGVQNCTDDLITEVPTTTDAVTTAGYLSTASTKVIAGGTAVTSWITASILGGGTTSAVVPSAGAAAGGGATGLIVGVSTTAAVASLGIIGVGAWIIADVCSYKNGYRGRWSLLNRCVNFYRACTGNKYNIHVSDRTMSATTINEEQVDGVSYSADQSIEADAVFFHYNEQ